MKCPNCGKELPDGAKFCFMCGTEIGLPNLCIECGIELPVGAKFCFKCGKKLEVQANDDTVVNIKKEEKRQPRTKQMSIYGRTVTVPIDEVALYWAIDKIGKELGDMMLQAYKKMGTLERVTIEFPKLAEKMYEAIAQTMLGVLAKEYQMYSVSEADILHGSCDVMTGLSSFYKTMCRSYNKLTGEKRNEELYRDMRKDSRFRIVGGGFGISGAVQGMIIAEGANFATGILHSIYNGIDGMLTDSRIDDAMDTCYREGAKKVKEALLIDIKQIVLYVGSCYFWPGHIFVINEDGIKRSHAIMNSIKQMRVPQDEIKNQVVEAIQSDIINQELMCWAYDNIGDPDDEIKAIAEELEYEAVIKHIECAEKIKEFAGDFADELKEKSKTDVLFNSILGDLEKPLPELLVLMYQRVTSKVRFINYGTGKMFFYCDSSFKIKWENALRTVPFFCSINKDEIPLLVVVDATVRHGHYGLMLTSKAVYTPFRRYEMKNISRISVKEIDSSFRWYSICINGIEACSGDEELSMQFSEALCVLLEHYVYLYNRLSGVQTNCVINDNKLYDLHDTAKTIGMEFKAFNANWRETLSKQEIQNIIQYYIKNGFFDKMFVNSDSVIYLNDGSSESAEHLEYAMEYLVPSALPPKDEIPLATVYEKREEGFFKKKLVRGLLMTTKHVYLVSAAVDDKNMADFNVADLNGIDYVEPTNDKTVRYGGEYSIRLVAYTGDYGVYRAGTYLRRQKFSDILNLLNWIFNERKQAALGD